MIGQHIYSRCLEGYFSKATMSADSTTVTIGMDMFVREDQAKAVARECERIAVLEDTRPVPDALQGPYRGILKIRRINRQISVVCRSYRLHSGQNQNGGFSRGGESRDFTYSSSYILTGEEKDYFFANPEYALNIQDFEAYPSIMRRIEESRARGYNGRIEEDKNYNLFRSNCRTANLEVFKKAGFTEKLFVEYISSILQRVANAPYEGHEKDKVLVVLPRRFNPSWNTSGGNAYAEEVMVATFKVLPEFVRSQLNATTGGQSDPEASVLSGYQLVFMEESQMKDWRRMEYSVIDLEHQTSYVTDGLDKTYAQFLWDNLNNVDRRKSFDAQYLDLFGSEKVDKGDNSPEKLAYVFKIFEAADSGFPDPVIRNRYMQELIQFSDESWTDTATSIVHKALNAETRNPQYDPGMEQALLGLIGQEECPISLKEDIVRILVDSVVHGTASQKTLKWMHAMVVGSEPLVQDVLAEAGQKISADRNTPWYLRQSLLQFYCGICTDDRVGMANPVKGCAMDAMENWYVAHIQRQEYNEALENLIPMMEALDQMGVNDARRKAIYQKMIYLLFINDEDVRVKAADYIKREEQNFASGRIQAMTFWECLKIQLEQDHIRLNKEIIWQLTFFEILNDKEFLDTEWSPVYSELVKTFAVSQPQMVFGEMIESILSWQNQTDQEDRLRVNLQALSLVLKTGLSEGQPYFRPSMKEMRVALTVLENGGMSEDVMNILYSRYQLEKDTSVRKEFFLHELKKADQCKVMLKGILTDTDDVILHAAGKQFGNYKADFLQTLGQIQPSGMDSLAKISDFYFSLVKKQAEMNIQQNNNPLSVWSTVFANERALIRENWNSEYLITDIGQKIQSELETVSPEYVGGLGKNDIQILKSILGNTERPGWECLGVLDKIYTLNESDMPDDFLRLRKIVGPEQNRGVKSAYFKALSERTRELASSDDERFSKDRLYNYALLEEQMQQELTGRTFNFDKVNQKLFGDAQNNRLLSALKFLQVINGYSNAYESNFEVGPYDCQYLKQGFLQEVLNISETDVEQFRDRRVIRAYKNLPNEQRALLKQRGFYSNMEELPAEVLASYNIHSERGKGDTLIPVISAILCGLLGVGLNVAAFLLYDKIGLVPVIISGCVLAGLGLLGNIIGLVVLFASKSRRSTVANTLFVIFSILAISGTILTLQGFLKENSKLSTEDSQLAEVEKENQDYESRIQDYQSQIDALSSERERAEAELRAEEERKAREEKYGVEGLEDLKSLIDSRMIGKTENWSLYIKNLSANEYMSSDITQMKTGRMAGLYLAGMIYEKYYMGEGIDDISLYSESISQMLNGDQEGYQNALMNLTEDGSMDSGVAMLNEYLRNKGYSNTTLDSQFSSSFTTAEDLGNFMSEVAKSGWGSSLTDTLKSLEVTKILRKGLPDEISTADLAVSFEYDADESHYYALNDALIVYGGESGPDYIFCIMVQNVTDYETVLAEVGDLSSEVYLYFNPPQMSSEETEEAEETDAV